MTYKPSKHDLAFERDIRPELQNDVMQMIAEAAAGWNEHACVTILERDRLDAINVWVHGIVEVDGEEYTFHLGDGNNAGTVLHDWNGSSGEAFEPLPRTVWTLQPSRDTVSRAILSGKGPFLIMKWDHFITRPEIRDIARNYAYDRYVQPGGLIEKHYRDAAAKHHFELVDKETADETRKRLEQATEAYPVMEI